MTKKGVIGGLSGRLSKSGYWGLGWQSKWQNGSRLLAIALAECKKGVLVTGEVAWHKGNIGSRGGRVVKTKWNIGNLIVGVTKEAYW